MSYAMVFSSKAGSFQDANMADRAPLPCSSGRKGGFVPAFPAKGLRHSASLDWLSSHAQSRANHCCQGTYMDGISFSGNTWIPKWNLETKGRRKWTMDTGKASKKCTPWHLNLYLPSLLSRKVAYTYAHNL